jgi:hypothetical protein
MCFEIRRLEVARRFVSLAAADLSRDAADAAHERSYDAEHTDRERQRQACGKRPDADRLYEHGRRATRPVPLQHRARSALTHAQRERRRAEGRGRCTHAQLPEPERARPLANRCWSRPVVGDTNSAIDLVASWRAKPERRSKSQARASAVYSPVRARA